MMQFVDNKPLQLVGGFSLFRIDTGLLQEGLGINACLFEQNSKAVILSAKNYVFRRVSGFACGNRRAPCALIPLARPQYYVFYASQIRRPIARN
jgi:hypothetical protein